MLVHFGGLCVCVVLQFYHSISAFWFFKASYVLLFCFLLWKSGDRGLFEKKQDRTTNGQ